MIIRPEPSDLIPIATSQIATVFSSLKNNEIDIARNCLAKLCHPLEHIVLNIEDDYLRPLYSIFSIIYNRYRGFAFMEYPYVDLEFLKSHSYLYNNSFTAPIRTCGRFHFFSGNIDPSLLKNCFFKGEFKFINAGEKNHIEGSFFQYRGFCVLRPIGMPVARASVEFDIRTGETVSRDCPEVSLLPGEVDGSPCLTCSEKVKAHIFSTKIFIDSPQYVQEESNLGHCGPSSVWVATHAMENWLGAVPSQFLDISYKTRVPHSSDHIQNIPFDPYDSSEGIEARKLEEFLTQAGCSVFHSALKSELTPLANYATILGDIYSFIESGLPVILFIHNPNRNEAHAVTLVGHSLPNDINIGPLSCPFALSLENARKHKILGTGINIYYAHDNAYGPFNRINFLRPTNNISPPSLQVEIGTKKEKYLFDGAFLVGPSEVRNYGISIPYEYGPFRDHLEKYFDKITDAWIVWRKFLTSGGDFKNSLLRRNFSPKTIEAYNSMHLPKYIWVYEFSVEKDFLRISRQNNSNAVRHIWGEVLLDATAKGDCRKIPVAYRLGNVICDPFGARCVVGEGKTYENYTRN